MLKYKYNVLQALNQAGYNTNVIRKEKLIAEATLQNIRNEKPISWATIEIICRLLECQPSDFLIYEAESEH